MVSTSEYKKLLKNHAKFKIVKKTPQSLSESGEDKGILFNVQLKRVQGRITTLENKIKECKDKKIKLTLEMSLRKEKAKLKTLNGDV